MSIGSQTSNALKPSRPRLPIVGMIGPTNIARVSEAGGIDPALYKHYANEAGRLIAKLDAIIALVPDRGVAGSKSAWFYGGIRALSQLEAAFSHTGLLALREPCL